MASHRVRFGLAAVGAALASLYFMAGYAMHASFSVSNPGQGHERMGVASGIACLVSAAAAVGFVIAAWRSGRKRPASARR